MRPAADRRRVPRGARALRVTVTGHGERYLSGAAGAQVAGRGGSQDFGGSVAVKAAPRRTQAAAWGRVRTPSAATRTQPSIGRSRITAWAACGRARAAARAAGADVTLISGPVELDDPAGVTMIHVESARDMLRHVEVTLPVDIAIFAAAVADWRVAQQGEQKLKKTAAGMPPLQLVENPDILATISRLKDKRPPLVIGFAAETEHLIENAKAKLARKGCDWIVANDVSPASGVMGGDRNTVHLLTRHGGNVEVDSWPVMTKEEVAAELIAHVAKAVSQS